LSLLASATALRFDLPFNFICTRAVVKREKKKQQRKKIQVEVKLCLCAEKGQQKQTNHTVVVHTEARE
jgi:hypothetical protein